MPTHRDSPHSHAALVERVVLLRTALKGLTNDHTALHRQLSRVRAENASLRAQLKTPAPAPTMMETAVR